ncbi:hypothetical protein CC2G_012780 [Coprinopsis cinerea AmutBmut pab1-1]|nr:hypothetical protein CC2G_012780 [Coprinopsis cinerea AmutBmut pab1-1]
MTSTLEIISFAASQSFIDNPEVLKPALDTLRAAKPVGSRTKRPDTSPSACINGDQICTPSSDDVHNPVWDSVPDAAQRKEFEEKSNGIINEPVTTLHVQVDSTLIGKALEAPATEFALAKLKGEDKRQAFNDVTAGVIKIFNAGTGNYGPTFGPVTQGTTSDIVIVVGWDSPQTHADAVKEIPDVMKLFELSDLTVVHVAFKKL